MTKTTKKTAANTPALARVKAKMNAAIYKATMDAYNRGGEEAARAYLGQHFWSELRQQILDEIFNG